MGRAETRLKLFKNVVAFEMVLKVSGNNFLQNLGKKWQVGYGPIISKGFILLVYGQFLR